MSRAVERRFVNPLNRALMRRGRLADTYAVLETMGRRSGRPRQIPVANGLDGDVFWLISAHGSRAHYVQNLLANPRVRIGLVAPEGLVWREGTAQLLPEDDTLARQRELSRGRLGYRLDAVLLRALATQLRTVRIDLEPDGTRGGLR